MKITPWMTVAAMACMTTASRAQETAALITPQEPLPQVVSGSHRLEQDAARDLCRYLSRITGRNVTVTRGKGQAKGKVIVHIGRDPFVMKRVPKIDKLHGDGFVLRWIKQGERLHLVLAGKMPRSAQWAVERFLHNYCGVRWLFPDRTYGEVVPQRKTIVVDRRLDRTVEPHFVGRSNCGMYFFGPPHRLLRQGPFSESYGQHALQFMFTGKEFRQHPEWFAYFQGKRQWWSYGNGWQICTRHSGTVSHAVDYADAHFKRNPHAAIVSIGQNDGNGWCECEECKRFANSVSPPYNLSELWFDWVNRVARQVAKKHPGKWVEAMAYSSTSSPPRFKLEPNVAVTKTFVLDSEFDLAERWSQVCRSVNLYSYMYGSSFLGFRHYPKAAQQFLKWGHDKLGALAHVTECGGDWTFDGPKYYYLQALQWNVNVDVNQVMDEFCSASYGQASAPMRAFWDRLEQIYERRKPGPYRNAKKDWLFYQWVSWATSSYVQPNDEFRDYTWKDVEFLDACFAQAFNKKTTPHEQFRLHRLADAWAFYRSLLTSYLKFYPRSLDVSIKSESELRSALELAKKIVIVRRQREQSLAKMRSYPHINPRVSQPAFWAGATAISILSHERALLDELCSAVSRYREKASGRAAAVQQWLQTPQGDPLFATAQSQLQLLSAPPTNRLINGGFESRDLRGWQVTKGYVKALNRPFARQGKYCAGTIVRGAATISQRVRVSAMERYRLTVWCRYGVKPPPLAVPMEATVEFHDGQTPVFAEPTRGLIRTLDPSAGWVRLRLSVSVPPRADSATIKLKSTFNGMVYWDHVVFERIRKGPAITRGELVDNFNGKQLDRTKWSRVPGLGGVDAPRVAKGWLVMRGKNTHAIASLARFNKLIEGRGKKRYRLRFRAAALASAGRQPVMSFSIGNTRQPRTRLLWYLYLSRDNGQRPRLSVFCDQSDARKFSTTFSMNHLGRGTDLWCTLLFTSQEVTVFAASGRYDESKSSFVGRYKHGITRMTAGGSVYLTLHAGPYKCDQLSLIPVSKP